jgi:tetratricopeptide (TPR) repeat protein
VNEDWHTIPGNQQAFQRLCEVIKAGEAIAFVGAGASAGLYPLWAELIGHLMDQAVSRGLATDANRIFWRQSQGQRPKAVTRLIKEKLGEGIYRSILGEIFAVRRGADGKPYTAVHAALIALSFRGFVTTNFDPALLEARLALRRDVGSTGWATWKDDAVHGWITGDVFKTEPCPILFAHGVHQRPDTIVLSLDEYREAYRTGAWRRCFDRLWGQDKLVFIGFGFSDPWLDFLADDVITQTAARDVSLPRHLAVMGRKDEDGEPADLRKLFADQYDAEVLFYPIAKRPDGGEDHTGLKSILETLASKIGVVGAVPKFPAPTAALARSAPLAAMPQHWSHETTEDERFTGRAEALSKLDRWAADPEVRVIVLTGLGGLGKTSLVGHWLKTKGGVRKRPIQGLFFWSFYADRDVKKFAEAFVDFAVKEVKTSTPKEVGRGKAALAVLRGKPILLVLDGLEVLQEQPGTAGYGGLLEDELRDLLDGACRLAHPSLVVMTSRFPFADLTPYLGSGLRALDLDRLTPEEGAALLAACGITGTPDERQAVSRRLEGHALGLRIFALTLTEEAKGDPSRAIEQVFDAATLSENDPFERKLRQLLGFYETRLPRDRVALLGLVSLFRTPVPEQTLLTLARRLPAVADALADFSDDALRRALQQMGHEHLLSRELTDDGSPAWSCHPILRDHFRQALLGWAPGVGTTAAGLLAGQPSTDRPVNIRALEPVLAAVELLLGAGDFDSANRLYSDRLGQIFLSLPAPAEGMRCALGFVRDNERRQRCEQSLSSRGLGMYLNEVGLLALHAGEFALALPFLEDSSEIARFRSNKRGLTAILHNQSELLAVLGRLGEAEAIAREALALARAVESEPATQTKGSLARLASILARQGKVGESLAAFDAANVIERRLHPGGAELHSVRGVWWAALLLRIGRIERAKALTDANLSICNLNRWQHAAAQCRRVLGAVATVEAQFDEADCHHRAAEATFRHGHMISHLPEVLLDRGELERRRGYWDEAKTAADEALRLSALRQMQLDHADALVLRARLSLERARAEDATNDSLCAIAERAGDDLDAALGLSRRCSYAWAERDALKLLADTSEILGRTDEALTLHRDAQLLSRRLADTHPPPEARSTYLAPRRRRARPERGS